MIEDVGHLLGDGIGIDRYRNGAQRLRGAHRPVEARPVGADDRGLVAPLETELLQTERKRAHLLEHLRPGPHLPDPEVLVPIGRAARIKASVADQELGERVCGFGRHGNPPYYRVKSRGPPGPSLPFAGRPLSPHKKMGLSAGQARTWSALRKRVCACCGYSAALSSGAGPARS